MQEETYPWVRRVAFIPLFLFRMLSWLLIMMLLHNFTLFVTAGFLLLNWIVFFLGQDHHEPLKQSLLSLVFPVIKLPSAKVNQQADLKLLAWCQSYKTFFSFSLMLLSNTQECVYQTWFLKQGKARSLHIKYLKVLFLGKLPLVENLMVYDSMSCWQTC